MPEDKENFVADWLDDREGVRTCVSLSVIGAHETQIWFPSGNVFSPWLQRFLSRPVWICPVQNARHMGDDETIRLMVLVRITSVRVNFQKS